MAAASSAPPVAALAQVKSKRGRLQGAPSSSVVHHHHHHHHLPHAQRRMGPAPFASFEDLSDDMDSPSEDRISSAENKMPGIKEDPTPTGESGGAIGEGPGPSVSTLAPTTPRIDISRASSSSHHDSNSSPERELFTADGGVKLGLGFKEEGAADLRSSTEELAYHGEPSPKEGRRKSQISQSSQLDPSAAASLSGGAPDRKDSACSDTGLLCISGRTSRLSSVGSASSGRSPSPHKMLLETSFCGSKPIPSRSVDVDSPTRERVLLSRETDPTKAVLAEESTSSQSPPQKPVTLQLHSDARSRPVQSFTQLVKPTVNEPVPEPEVIVVAECSSITTTATTTSPSPASRKTSLASLASPKTPTGSKRRLTNLLREASGGFKERSRSRSKSRERTASLISGGSTSSTSETKKSDSRKSSTSKGSGGGGVFGLFKKKKDKPSPQDISATSDSSKLDAIEFTFRDAQLLPSESVMLPNLDTERLQTRIIELNPKSGDVTSQIIELKPRSPRSPRSPHQLQGEVIEIESAQIIELKPRTLNEPFKPQVVQLQKKIKPPKEVPTEIVMLTREPYRTGQGEYRPETPEPEPEPKCSKHQPSSSPASPIQPPSFATASIEHHQTPVSIEKELSLEMATQTDDIETTTTILLLSSTVSAAPILASASNNSSDSEADYANTVPMPITAASSGIENEVSKILDPQNIEDDELETERRGLFGQQDSLEDELPFVPTTLPQERTRGVCLVPSKQRPSEVKTCPVERPRSCTPIKPALLDEFVQLGGTSTSPGSTTPGNLSGGVGAGIGSSSGGSGSSHSPASDKMRILLPGTEGRLTSGRRQSREPAPTWYEFAERGLQSPREFRRTSSPPSPPPPLPPRASTTPQTPPAKAWVNFEEIPERKKLPKRIQTLPSAASEPPVIYSYVNPEDCKCECHASSRASGRGGCNHTAPVPAARSSTPGQPPPRPAPRSRTSLSLDPPPEKQHSYLSDSSSESPSPYNLEPTTSNIGGQNGTTGHKSMKPFGMDLDVSSNRSSIVSQEENSPELVTSPTN